MDSLRDGHTPQAIRRRLEEPSRPSPLRDLVLGAIDGTVTTFAVAAGAVGADLSGGIALVLGLANLLADGFSMAAGNFLGTRAEHQDRARARRVEVLHLAMHPEGEREEIRQILASKGFAGDVLERAVDVITEDHERWIDMMLREEYGFAAAAPEPLRSAAATFVAFCVAGSFPLLPFALDWLDPTLLSSPFELAATLAAIAFFAIGFLKGRIVSQSGWRSGLETLAIGGGAAALAYGIGVVLRGVAGAS